MKIEKLPNREFNNRLLPEVGSKIKSAREKCGLNQQELADLIGYKSATAISLIENNKRMVSAIHLWCIAQITNQPITYFL